MRYMCMVQEDNTRNDSRNFTGRHSSLGQYQLCRPGVLVGLALVEVVVDTLEVLVVVVDVVLLEVAVVVIGAGVVDVVVDLVAVLLVKLELLVPEPVPVELKDPTYAL
jgi:hypothetical protein